MKSNYYETLSSIILCDDENHPKFQNHKHDAPYRLNNLVLLKYFINYQYVHYNHIPLSNIQSPEVNYVILHHNDVSHFFQKQTTPVHSLSFDEIISNAKLIYDYTFTQLDSFVINKNCKYFDDYFFLLTCYMSVCNSNSPYLLQDQKNCIKPNHIVTICNGIKKEISKPKSGINKNAIKQIPYADFVIPQLYLLLSDLTLVDKYNSIMDKLDNKSKVEKPLSKLSTLLSDLSGNSYSNDNGFRISAPTTPALYFNNLLKNLSLNDANDLFSNICNSHSTNRSHDYKASTYSGVTNICNLLKSLIKTLPLEVFAIIPSILTIFINSIIPHKSAHIPTDLTEDDSYCFSNQFAAYIQVPNLKRKTKSSKRHFISKFNKTRFLKMLLLTDFPTHYSKNGTTFVDNLFLNKEWKMMSSTYQDLCEHALYPYHIKQYNEWGITTHNIRPNPIKKEDVIFYYTYIKPHVNKKNYNINTFINDYKKNPNQYQLSELDLAMINDYHCDNTPITAATTLSPDKLLTKTEEYISNCSMSFNFQITYDFFKIFTLITKNIKNSKYECLPKTKIDIALSLLHLNQFSEWIDSLAIIYGLPEDYNEQSKLFYTKLFMCNHPLRNELKIPDYDKEQLKNKIKNSYCKYDIQNSKASINNRFNDAFERFYSLSDECLNTDMLLSILEKPNQDISQNHSAKASFRNIYIYQRIKQLEAKSFYPLKYIEQMNYDLVYQYSKN